MSEPYADMHMHTTYSDGSESIEKLFKMALKKKLKAIVITDHDYSDHYSEINFIAEKYNIETCRGIEISTYYKDKEIHLLAYGYNNSNRLLSSQINRIRDDRIIRARKIIENLNTIYSLNLNFKDLIDIAETNIGRPHIAKLLIQKKICKTQQEAFYKYLNSQSPAYVEKYRLDSLRAIELVNKSGAISVLAHFGRYHCDSKILMELIEAGLKGIEVFHPSHNTANREMLIQTANSHQLFMTGGSDYHGHNSTINLGSEHVPYAYFKKIIESLQNIKLVQEHDIH